MYSLIICINIINYLEKCLASYFAHFLKAEWFVFLLKNDSVCKMMDTMVSSERLLNEWNRL